MLLEPCVPALPPDGDLRAQLRRTYVLKRYEDGPGPSDVRHPKVRCLLLSVSRDWQASQTRYILRKEVIQPQVPLRLPCYDFTPVAEPTVASCPLERLAHRLRVDPTPMV